MGFFLASYLSIESFGHYNSTLMLFSLLAFFHLDFPSLYYNKIAREGTKPQTLTQYSSNFIFIIIPFALVCTLISSLFLGKVVFMVFGAMMLNQTSLFYLHYLRTNDEMNKVSQILFTNSLLRLAVLGAAFLLKTLFTLHLPIEIFILAYASANFFSILLRFYASALPFYGMHVSWKECSWASFIDSLKEGGFLIFGTYVSFFVSYADRFSALTLLGEKALGIVSFYKMFGGVIVGLLAGNFNSFFYPKIPSFIKGESRETLTKYICLFTGIIILYSLVSPWLVKIYLGLFALKYMPYLELIYLSNALAGTVFFLGIKTMLYTFHHKGYFVFLSAAILAVPGILLGANLFYPLNQVQLVLEVTFGLQVAFLVLSTIVELFIFPELRPINRICLLCFLAFVAISWGCYLFRL